MNKVILFIVALGFLALIYTFFEARILRVKKHSVYSEKLPSEFDGYTIAFISDLHNYSRKGLRIRRLVSKINLLNPDIVLIGGDFNSNSSPDPEVCYRELSEIQAPKYAVLGNHDYVPHEELAKSFIKKYGIGNINNKSFWVRRGNSKIKIGGMDDYWLGYPYPESFLHDLSEDDFSILVCHNPDFFEVFEMKRVSLALAGHHHGGQCSFFGLWAPMVRSEFGRKYTKSRKLDCGTEFICSNGIGTSHLPVRFCAIPEINYITLYTNGENYE